MKKFSIIVITLIIFIGFLGLTFDADAAVRVRGYYRKDGTYVQPHYRSNPDGNPYNNWSFPGNINPYTGKVAPGNPDTYLKNYDGGSSGKSSLSLPSIPSYTQSAPIINAPANAYVSGSDWYCNSGYKTIYNNGYKVGCEKVIAPANAYVSGSDWYCNSGYKTIYNNGYKVGCEPIR